MRAQTLSHQGETETTSQPRTGVVAGGYSAHVRIGRSSPDVSSVDKGIVLTATNY